MPSTGEAKTLPLSLKTATLFLFETVFSPD